MPLIFLDDGMLDQTENLSLFLSHPRCNDDYKLSHSDEIECVTNTTYSPDLPTCNSKSGQALKHRACSSFQG